jgi:hypothetical protein
LRSWGGSLGPDKSKFLSQLSALVAAAIGSTTTAVTASSAAFPAVEIQVSRNGENSNSYKAGRSFAAAATTATAAPATVTAAAPVPAVTHQQQQQHLQLPEYTECHTRDPSLVNTRLNLTTTRLYQLQ